jgi:hypothetical protein
MTRQTSLRRITREKAIRLHEEAITLQQKIPIDIRRRLYQAIVVNIALWGAKALKETDRSKLSQRCSPQDV